MRSSRRSTRRASELAVARLGEQLVLDHAAHARRLVGERALVELREDGLARAGEQVRGDAGLALGETHGVEFAADEAQERGLDLGVGELGAARHEAHDRLGHLARHQPSARAEHRRQRLRAAHAGEPHAVLRDRGHRALERFEVREVVLAERDQHAIVGACEVEVLGGGLVEFEAPLQRRRRPVLDQVGEFLDELLRPQPAAVVGLGQREDLLELVEDQ